MLSEAKHVAPGKVAQNRVQGLKGRDSISPFSGLVVFFNVVTRGDALRFARACPWLPYLTPSALLGGGDFCADLCLVGEVLLEELGGGFEEVKGRNDAH